MTHTEAFARQYINEKHLIELTQAFTSAIAYNKPEKPAEFLVDIVTKLKDARDNDGDALICFTREDIAAMFTALDPFKKKTVTRAQMEGAMLNFGVAQDVIEEMLSETSGPYSEEDFTALIVDGYRKTILP